jgi:hypothetical protein
MAIKQFAVPLDTSSHQTGEITFQKLKDTATSAEFQITNVEAGADNYLNLITKKKGTTTDHVLPISIASGTGTVTYTASQIALIYGDASGGDWDYVEARWNVGEADKPEKSVMYEVQGGRTYDINGWPPNP